MLYSLALTKLPRDLASVENFAFSNCKKLALAALPDQLTKINSYAFSGCTDLALQSLPDRLTIVDNAAFYGCTSLALTKLPENLVKIGDGAFTTCTGLSSLTFPQSTAPQLGKNAFYGIPGLVLFVPHGAAGYDGGNWPREKVVYGAALSSLEISSGALVPSFFPGTGGYSVFVDNAVERVTVTPTAHGSESITVNGTAVPSGAASDEIQLTAGAVATVTMHVKNSDADSRAYTIQITRAAPDAVAVMGVTLDLSALTLYTSQAPHSARLTATVQPKNADTKAVSWTSDAPGVAAVDGSGKVTAVAPGSAAITVTTADGGKTASCAVTVKTGGSSGGGGGSSDSGSSYIRRVLKDKATGVVVEGDRIHEYAALEVRAGALHKAGDTGCDLLRRAQAGGRVLQVCDVSLSRSFLGRVTVAIPVEGRDGQPLTVAHCAGGKLNLSDVEVSGGFAKVETDALSPFALLDGVCTLAALEALAVPGIDNPDTGGGTPGIVVKDAPGAVLPAPGGANTPDASALHVPQAGRGGGAGGLMTALPVSAAGAAALFLCLRRKRWKNGKAE